MLAPPMTASGMSWLIERLAPQGHWKACKSCARQAWPGAVPDVPDSVSAKQVRCVLCQTLRAMGGFDTQKLRQWMAMGDTSRAIWQLPFCLGNEK